MRSVPRAWVDPALALVLSVAAVALAVHTGDEPVNADLPAPDIAAAADRIRWTLPVDGDAPPSTTLVVLESLLATAPLAVRRRWPLAAFVAQFAGVATVGGRNSWVTIVALLIGAYTLAAWGRWPVVSVAALLACAVTVAVSFERVSLPIPDAATPFAILLPFALFGLMTRALRGRAAASAERAEALRSGQEAATRAAVAEERARIARELHDVVSHHVSVMVIQAGAAGEVLDGRPDQARRALAAIRDSGTEAMGELRQLLGVLSPSSDGPLRPQPGLDQLDALVDKVRAAGQPVTVRHTAPALPRGVDLTAYRVVQEGLTNALRYAPGAPTSVTIELEGDELLVEVLDTGAGARLSLGSGSGLVGLAERLRLYSGTLEAGRRVGGGFRVAARLPLATA